VVIHNHASLWFNVVARGDNDVITIGERTKSRTAPCFTPTPASR